jgi:hypothetical protein
MQLLRKISAKTMGWEKSAIQEKCIVDKKNPHLLYRVVGIASGTRSGKSKFDDREDAQDWVALLGSFQGTSNLTGEVFRAGVCFMPNYVVDAVAGQLVGDVESVKFAYDIYAKYDEKSATSYVFLAEPLMEVATDDPLAALSTDVGKDKPLAIADKSKSE